MMTWQIYNFACSPRILETHKILAADSHKSSRKIKRKFYATAKNVDENASKTKTNTIKKRNLIQFIKLNLRAFMKSFKNSRETKLKWMIMHLGNVFFLFLSTRNHGDIKTILTICRKAKKMLKNFRSQKSCNGFRRYEKFHDEEKNFHRIADNLQLMFILFCFNSSVEIWLRTKTDFQHIVVASKCEKHRNKSFSRMLETKTFSSTNVNCLNCKLVALFLHKREYLSERKLISTRAKTEIKLILSMWI